MKVDEQFLDGAAEAAGIILDRMLGAMSSDRGVHIESLFTALGSHAGHACQLAALDGLAREDPDYTGLSYIEVQGANGDTYLYGDAINRPLAASSYSFWELVGTKLRELNAEVPDANEYFAHSAATAGTAEFGLPRYAEGTAAGDTPRGYLPSFETLQPTYLASAPDPQQWPVAYGIAVRSALELTGGQFDYGVLARIVMDSAIATSKLKI